MSTLFGTDGIRGVVGEWPLVPDFFVRLGYAFGVTLNEQFKFSNVVIGRDTRQSGVMLQNALTSGLLASGINVIDVGVIPTAGVAWLVRKLEAEAGIIISASHNPFDQNGVKFFDREGFKLSNSIEHQIEHLINLSLNVNSNHQLMGKRIGELSDSRNLCELYIQDLLAEHPDLVLDGMSLVVDCANGSASHIASTIFDRLGARVISIHATPTGSNINSSAGSEHVRREPNEMKQLIHQYRANFGLAFDGDADRVVFIDEEGKLVDGDHMLGILANYFDRHSRLLAKSVVTTTMRNSGLKAYIEKAGLKLFETSVGDKYVVEKLVELHQKNAQLNSIGLGGEQAGHIVLIDNEHTTGDGIRSALFVIQALLESKTNSMATLAASIGKTPQIIASAYIGSGERYNKEELQNIQELIKRSNPHLSRISLRYSGTEAQFRAMLESDGNISEDNLALLALVICENVQAKAGIKDEPIDFLNCTQGGVLSPMNNKLHQPDDLLSKYEQ